MNSIKILATGKYLPSNVIDNKYFNEKFNLENNWIYQRTGIKQRFWAKSETTGELAIKAVEDLLNANNEVQQNELAKQASKVQQNELAKQANEIRQNKLAEQTRGVRQSSVDLKKTGLIVVASTNYENSMPGVSFEIQKKFNIENCMCMDILAGCSGYINGLDIARKYIELGDVEQALVIGVEKLSKYINQNDVNTAILLGDGAGATLLGKAENKKYAQNIESIGQDGDILTSKENEKIYMDGKKIYKFGTARVAKNINALLEKEKLDISEIKYIVPHQSNQRILTSMAEKIGARNEQMYMNIVNVGNTFNASIPIALNEIVRNNLLKENDKIILVGYGGGLNLGSILIEV